MTRNTYYCPKCNANHKFDSEIGRKHNKPVHQIKPRYLCDKCRSFHYTNNAIGKEHIIYKNLKSDRAVELRHRYDEICNKELYDARAQKNEQKYEALKKEWDNVTDELKSINTGMFPQS